ncbi:hypothetical protein Btru_067212 [Bulinus truncatus]|nr:hypothetical protein Btru_067212 [Bulinus truncatus]
MGIEIVTEWSPQTSKDVRPLEIIKNSNASLLWFQPGLVDLFTYLVRKKRRLRGNEHWRGPIPPSIFGPASKKDDDGASEPVKAKRKCGRPRNPIPRHKRESHINAEHRRRGKIQNGFRTLKGLVPKYEHSSGRDSKADILFKAVDHCKLLTQKIEEMKLASEAMMSERDSLNEDIKNFQTFVPNLKEMTKSMDDRFDEYVEDKCNNGWASWTLKLIVRPLFDSYVTNVFGTSLGDFLVSVKQWADKSMSPDNMRHLFQSSLPHIAMGTEMDSSVDMEVDRFPMLPDMASHEQQIGDDKAIQANAFHPDTTAHPSTPATGYSPNVHHAYSPHNITAFSPQAPSTQAYSPHDPSAHTFSPHSPVYGAHIQSYSPEHHSIQACDSEGVDLMGAAGGDNNNNVCGSFEDDSRVLSNLSPRLGLQHSADLLPFSDHDASGHMCHNVHSNSLFADLHLNMDIDQGYLRPSTENFNAWQDQQQTYVNYSEYNESDDNQPHLFETNENESLANAFFEINNKTQTNWQSENFIASELDHPQTEHLTDYNTFSERDNKFDSPVSQAASPTLMQKGSSQDIGHRVRLAGDGQRLKSLSLSSTESDTVGLLGMSSRHTLELLRDHDRYCPLTPSTDGCNSPVEISHLDSPFTKHDRAAHDTIFHDGSRDLSFQTKLTMSDPLSKPSSTNHFPSFLPSYKEAFGPRDSEYRHVKGVSTREGGKTDVTPLYKFKNMESSSLLAELLGPTKYFKSNTSPTFAPGTNKGTGQVTFRHSSSSSPSQLYPEPDNFIQVGDQALPRPPSSAFQRQQRAPSSRNENRNNQFSGPAVIYSDHTSKGNRGDTARPSTNRSDEPSLENISKYKAANKISFEQAHQMLLQSYGLTSDSCNHKSHGEFACYESAFSRQKTSDLDTCSPVSDMPPVGQMAQAAVFVNSMDVSTLGQRLPSDKTPVSRKISFEESYSDATPTDSLDDCKKYWQWPNVDRQFEMDKLQHHFCSSQSPTIRKESLELKPVVNQV